MEWDTFYSLATESLQELGVNSNQHVVFGVPQCPHFIFTGYGRGKTVSELARPKLKRTIDNIRNCKATGKCSLPPPPPPVPVIKKASKGKNKKL